MADDNKHPQTKSSSDENNPLPPELPVLSLEPLPPFNMDEVNVEFQMEVTDKNKPSGISATEEDINTQQK